MATYTDFSNLNDRIRHDHTITLKQIWRIERMKAAIDVDFGGPSSLWTSQRNHFNSDRSPREGRFYAALKHPSTENSDELWRRPPKREASMFFLLLHSQQHPDTTESENQVGKPAAMKGDSRLMPPSLSKNSKADQ